MINDSKLFLGRNDANLATKVIRNKFNQIVAHGLGKGERRAEKEQTLDNVIRGRINKLGELSNRRTLGDLNNRVVKNQRGI